ncbi:leucine Rich Repeat protein, partial [Porphyromonas uenonis 60-3]
TALAELDCSSNQLTSLGVSDCTALTELNCWGNKLTSLDVSGCTALTTLSCFTNQLTSLDVSGCTSLTSLRCECNQLTSLNASGCTALTTLECSYNQLTSLDVSKNTALTQLYCYGNQINGENMTRLVNSLPDRKGMSAGSLVVSRSEDEKNLCRPSDIAIAREKNWIPKWHNGDSYKGIGEGVITMTTSKAVGEKVKLEIEANGDVLIEGVSESPQQYCNDYTLTSQTITIRGDVTTLYCYNNQLTSLDVSGCTSLTNLNCNSNQLSSLELLQNSALTSLACSRNELKSLDLSACTRLKSLECYRNKIRGNAVAQLVESLPDRYGKESGKFYFVYYSEDESEENFCYRPAVGRANDKNWRPQKHYSFSWEDYFGVMDEGVVMMRTAQEVGSQITLTLEAKGDVAIDGVKGVPETDGKPHQYTLLSQDVTIRGYVTKLHCSGNKLTSLDLSTTVPLVELDCSNNQLTALDVSQNAAVTSLTCYRNQIKGEAMALLIKGLPQLPLRSTHLFGIVSNAADEGNVFLKADVERVRDKGWSPMKWNEERHQYEPYAGKETETFAVTLTKEGKGTITATGADDLTAVPYGTELTIVATPTEGYELISLTAGEEDILATKKVVVTDNVTVKAIFDQATFAVSLTKEGKGTISATGADDLTAVPYGTYLTIVATPAAGYKLTALTANGKDILATKKVVVKGATEVKATFVDHTGVETTVTQQVKLYPNPATDYVIVEGVTPASEVTLHSLTGERLYAGRTDSRGVLQIDLTPYADGGYLVCVAGETHRVVVRR